MGPARALDWLLSIAGPLLPDSRQQNIPLELNVGLNSTTLENLPLLAHDCHRDRATNTTPRRRDESSILWSEAGKIHRFKLHRLQSLAKLNLDQAAPKCRLFLRKCTLHWRSC